MIDLQAVKVADFSRWNIQKYVAKLIFGTQAMNLV